MITVEILVATKICDRGTAAKWQPYLAQAAQRFEINTPEREAGWLAQCAHESNNFRALEENLNYSQEGLLKTFPKYFTLIEAASYARKPERIANRVYASRMGNGVEASGDGFKYRGRGLIQLTGKTSYRQYSLAIQDPAVMDNPSLLTQPEHAANSAGWFWFTHNLNNLADTQNVEAMTRVVNGGVNGLAHRKELYTQISAVLLA